jgi:hypothetical protein
VQPPRNSGAQPPRVPETAGSPKLPAIYENAIPQAPRLLQLSKEYAYRCLFGVHWYGGGEVLLDY